MKQITQILQEGNYPNSIPLRENLKDRIQRASNYHFSHECKCSRCSGQGTIYFDKSDKRYWFRCLECQLEIPRKLLNVK